MDSKRYVAGRFSYQGEELRNGIDPEVGLHVLAYEGEYEILTNTRPYSSAAETSIVAEVPCTVIFQGESYNLKPGDAVRVAVGPGVAAIFKGVALGVGAKAQLAEVKEDEADEGDLDEIRERFEEVTGRKPGRSKRETMLAAIAEAEADESE